MVQELHYPRQDVDPSEVFSIDTLNKALGELMSWQQAPGAFGNISLHGCWLESSVLRRRYQGQSVADQSYSMLRTVMTLFDKTSDVRWQLVARALVENVFFLQEDAGGFRHASGENEPSYHARRSCAIHQCMPILGLLHYYQWEHADGLLKGRIAEVIDRHWQWFHQEFWQSGNAYKSPLPHAGWSGVTNQDLVVVGALALWGKVLGNWEPYETVGRETLDVLLSDLYYFPAIAKFERGDQANFVERTPYYHIILEMSELIYECTGEERLPGVLEVIGRGLFDAYFEDEKGMGYLAWGAKTDASDKTCVLEWIKKPYYASPGLLKSMAGYLAAYPDNKLQGIFDKVERSLAAYVYADGTIAKAMGTGDPLFMVVSGGQWVSYLITRLSDDELGKVCPQKPATIKRVCGTMTWYNDAMQWRLEKDGKCAYQGVKLDSGAIAIGDEVLETAPEQHFDSPDIVEIVV